MGLGSAAQEAGLGAALGAGAGGEPAGVRPCSCCRDRGLSSPARKRTPSFPSRERHYAVRRKNKQQPQLVHAHSSPEMKSAATPPPPPQPCPAHGPGQGQERRAGKQDAVGVVLLKLEALELSRPRPPLRDDP